MYRRNVSKSGYYSNVSTHRDEDEEDNDAAERLELPRWFYGYLGLAMLLLIAAVVLIAITLADVEMFHDKVKHAVKDYDFKALKDIDFKKFKDWDFPEKFQHGLDHLIKLADGFRYGGGGGYGGGHGSGSGSGHDDDKHCPKGETHVYRPYESQLLQLPIQRYRKGLDDSHNEPNPRIVSQQLMGYDSSWKRGRNCEIRPNKKGLSAWVWQWGQFIDHDFALTLAGEQFGVMEVDITCDPVADPDCAGKSIRLTRSKYVLDDLAVRQQVEELSSYIDASTVYGHTYERYHALRAYEGGKLKTSRGDFMPLNEQGLPNAGGDGRTDLFLGGDIRANEQLGLTCVHTLWVREHNAWAERLYHEHPHWNDEQLYWTARRLVTAEIQVITYEEFLPALLGKAAQPHYYEQFKKYGMPPPKYNVNTDSSMKNEFVAAAYRFGHSMVGESLLLHNSKKKIHTCLPLRDTFFNPSSFFEHGMESVLGGLNGQPAEELDIHIVDSLRNFLHFAEFIDLATLNLMRGRDHGLPYYHELYYTMNGKYVKGWDDITSSKDLQTKLKQVYGDWKKLDVFTGILAEDHLEDSSLGLTGTTLLLDQFRRCRDSDPYFYVWDSGLPDEYRQEVEDTKLSDVVLRNTELTREDVQEHVFFVA